jgi:5'-3' exoribonuclease 1
MLLIYTSTIFKNIFFSLSFKDSVPFGLTGTIISLLEYHFEVLFDRPFIGGSTLGGKCSILRGAVVNLDEVFNINPNAYWVDFLLARNEQMP